MTTQRESDPPIVRRMPTGSRVGSIRAHAQYILDREPPPSAVSELIRTPSGRCAQSNSGSNDGRKEDRDQEDCHQEGGNRQEGDDRKGGRRRCGAREEGRRQEGDSRKHRRQEGAREQGPEIGGEAVREVGGEAGRQERSQVGWREVGHGQARDEEACRPEGACCGQRHRSAHARPRDRRCSHGAGRARVEARRCAVAEGSHSESAHSEGHRSEGHRSEATRSEAGRTEGRAGAECPEQTDRARASRRDGDRARRGRPWTCRREGCSNEPAAFAGRRPERQPRRFSRKRPERR